MSIRQRLQLSCELRKSGQICWRCGCGLPRPLSGVAGEPSDLHIVDITRNSQPTLAHEKHASPEQALLKKNRLLARYFKAKHRLRNFAKSSSSDVALQVSLTAANNAKHRIGTGSEDSNKSNGRQANKSIETTEKRGIALSVHVRRRSGFKIRKHVAFPEIQNKASPFRKVKSEQAVSDVVGKFQRPRSPVPSPENEDHQHKTLAHDDVTNGRESSLNVALPTAFMKPTSISTKTSMPLIRRHVSRRKYSTASSTHADFGRSGPPISGTERGQISCFQGGIREHLRLWRETQDREAKYRIAFKPSNVGPLDISRNPFTQAGEDDSFIQINEDDEIREDVLPDKDELDAVPDQTFLRRGDLVELWAGTEPVLAVFVRNLTSQAQFYTVRGEWVHRSFGSSRYSVPGFIKPSELDGILPYLPADEVATERMNRLQPMEFNAPRDAGANILRKMDIFTKEADSVYRCHADRLNRIYELIAPVKENAGRTYKSLKTIAMMVLQKKSAAELTQPMLWAVHRVLQQTQNVSPERNVHRQDPLYEIFPQQNMVNIMKVQGWVRDFQEAMIEDTVGFLHSGNEFAPQHQSSNPIAVFVKKARAAIEQSRLKRPLSAQSDIGHSLVNVETVEPDLKVVQDHIYGELDANDKAIITYFDAWVTSKYLDIYTDLGSLGPVILRAIGMYMDSSLDRQTGLTLLKELGVVTPWENLAIYGAHELLLPDHDTVSEEVTRLKRKSKLARLDSVPEDIMEGLRKDWGDMSVFCIDSAGSREIDDGVSIESVDGSSTEYWIHIHVANPSAYIKPFSPMARYAATLSETVYFPERKYPMLDPLLVNDYLSLDRDRPCITFSARVSLEGDVLEKKITSGVVHNVHFLTPHTAALGLGINIPDGDDSSTETMLHVGGEFPTSPYGRASKRTNANLQASDAVQLQLLSQLGQAIKQKRETSSIVNFLAAQQLSEAYKINVYLGKSAPPFRLHTSTFRCFSGDPIISIERDDNRYVVVRELVGELMILGGNVAANWCSDRGLPVPYRGLLRNPEPFMTPEEYKWQTIDPQIAQQGHVDWKLFRTFMQLTGQAGLSADPLPHLALGLPVYVRATSPLRRYVDLYTHWQIEAALRHEAKTGQSLVRREAEAPLKLAFTRPAVEELTVEARIQELKIRRMDDLSHMHWTVQAFYRAFYFQEAPLPETFEVEVLPIFRIRAAKAYLKGWGVSVVLEAEGWQEGDVWEGRIQEVRQYYDRIIMKGIRLLERDGEKVGELGG